MDRKFLKKNGNLLGEVDFGDNGIYDGTNYFYWYNDCLYISTYHSNLNSYTGKSETKCVGTKEKLSKELQTSYYLDIPAFMTACSEEVVKKVCEKCGVKYDEDNYFG